MVETFITVKKVKLNNNCPECFSKDDLQLIFKQKCIENVFMKCVTNHIASEMRCNICENRIYPERWTDDIERVFNYQQKAFTPRPLSRYFKKPFWIILAASSAVILTAIIILGTYL